MEFNPELPHVVFVPPTEIVTPASDFNAEYVVVDDASDTRPGLAAVLEPQNGHP